jgi:hypothetical protein
MARISDVEKRRKMSRLDKPAAGRFIKSGLRWGGKRKSEDVAGREDGEREVEDGEVETEERAEEEEEPPRKAKKAKRSKAERSS